MHAHVSHDLTDLFADLFGTDSPFADIFGWARRGQATTEKHASVITMDLPGRAKSDVSVKVKDRRITVEAKALKRKNSEGVEFYARPSVKESWRLSPAISPRRSPAR